MMEKPAHWFDEFIEFDNPEAELLLEICFGLLWMEQHQEARRTLSKYLTHAQKGAGITKAREIMKTAGKHAKDLPLPQPIARAVERLNQAADNCVLYEYNEEDAACAAMTYRAAAMRLASWAESMESGMQP